MEKRTWSWSCGLWDLSRVESVDRQQRKIREKTVSEIKSPVPRTLGINETDSIKEIWWWYEVAFWKVCSDQSKRWTFCHANVQDLIVESGGWEIDVPACHADCLQHRPVH